MPLYRATGNLVIRPCETCLALVLHEEGVLTKPKDLAGGEEVLAAPWRPFPHNAPGGARCIAGGAARATVPGSRAARAATAGRTLHARDENR